MSNRLVIQMLGYAGLLPFLLALVWWSLSLPDSATNAAFLFTSYSAIILSFIAGTLWGKATALTEGPVAITLLVLSNVFSLLAWGGLLAGAAHRLSLLLLGLGYASVYVLECRYTAALSERTPESYLAMRLNLTILVIVCHAMAFIWLT